jgi:hypothetical protein
VRRPTAISLAAVFLTLASVATGWGLRSLLAPAGPGATDEAPAPGAAAPGPADAEGPQRHGAGTPAAPALASWRSVEEAWSGSARSEGGPDPEEERAAERLEATMRRFLSDLEYSPGLPEPRQQVIAPIPPTWTPDPAAPRLPEPVIEDVSPRAAGEGDHVRIRGRNLRVAQVMFGDQPAQIMSDADDAVTVLAPPGVPGAVDVAVTNVDGTYAITTGAFTYRGEDRPGRPRQ